MTLNEQPRLSLEEFVDSQPLSRGQIIVALLCFLAVLLDGFDSILIGYVAPAIKGEWKLMPQQLAPLFGSGVFGLMLGAMVIGPFADRFGRKTILIASVAIFGVFTLVSAMAPDLHALVALRFLAGLGLGGAMPCAITLTSEYCPRRHRSLLVTTMFCGFTAGAAISGLTAAWLVTDLGWRAVFVVGGLLPLVFIPVLMAGLPESVRFLALRPGTRDRIARILARVVPGADAGQVDLAPRHEEKHRFPVARILQPGMAGGTLLIWVIYFANLLVLLFLNSWLPTLLSNLGMSMIHASAFTSTFQLGGAVGSIGLGWAMDRWKPSTMLFGGFLVGVIALLVIGKIGTDAAVLIPVLFLVGIGTGGSQTGAHVITSSYYATASRATGMSWALGVGRLGSVVGSMSGSYLMGAHWDANAMFTLMAGVLAVSAVGTLMLTPLLRLRRQASGRYAAA